MIILKGGATLSFKNEKDLNLTTENCIHIPVHKKHRVPWTDKNIQTI